MDAANSDDVLRQVALDAAEGAGMVMGKPALTSLDIIYRAKHDFGIPTFAFQVNGEYSMIRAAVANGWLDGRRAALESLLVIKRAGVDCIFTYSAPEIARGMSD
jgi:porphobilinogen synthase